MLVAVYLSPIPILGSTFRTRPGNFTQVKKGHLDQITAAAGIFAAE